MGAWGGWLAGGRALAFEGYLPGGSQQAQWLQHFLSTSSLAPPKPPTSLRSGATASPVPCARPLRCAPAHSNPPPPSPLHPCSAPPSPTRPCAPTRHHGVLVDGHHVVAQRHRPRRSEVLPPPGRGADLRAGTGCGCKWREAGAAAHSTLLAAHAPCGCWARVLGVRVSPCSKAGVFQGAYWNRRAYRPGYASS